MSREIFVTRLDQERLLKLIANEREFGTFKQESHLIDLEKELKRATILPSDQIPADAVTMNSQAVFKDLDSGEEEVYTLVYPEDADLENNRISILAPIGTAILGFREGDVFEWEVPSGPVHFRVEKILYQPEKAGDFDL